MSLALFKARDDRTIVHEPATTPAAVDEDDRVLACASCGLPVTTDAARIEVSGAHAHTFVNPAGVTFRIGCFLTAPGVAARGEASDYWTWFPPHTWQVEACRGCSEHLGWLFRSQDSAFHGLILTRLVELEIGGPGRSPA